MKFYSTYNCGVSAIRYVALLALVVWLGGMVTLSLLMAPLTIPAAEVQPFHWLEYVCGGLMLVCLVVIKLVGPPPRAFIPRAFLVVVMLAVAIYSGVMRETSTALMTVNMALGLVLLGWYVRE